MSAGLPGKATHFKTAGSATACGRIGVAHFTDLASGVDCRQCRASMKNVCLVIPRIVESSALRIRVPANDARQPGSHVCVELFLPHDAVNPGQIACWDGCHNEAATGYYTATKAPRTPNEREAADEAVRRYQAFMDSIPVADRAPIVRRDRLPRNWQTRAWGRHR